MASYLYDPKEVLVHVANIPILGFAKGQFLELEFNKPPWTVTESIDGGYCYTPRSNSSGTITMRLQQGSFGNLDLTRIASAADTLQRQNDNKAPEMLISVEDLSQTFNLILSGCIIIKEPKISYGVKATDGPREWVFYSPNITYKDKFEDPVRTESTLKTILKGAGEFLDGFL